MRHQLQGRKLGRTTSHRIAMFRNMASSLIEHGRIRTTLLKAKELRRMADQLVTLGKENTLHARRRAFDLIRNRDAVQKLFNSIAPAFEKRAGGYTRIFHLAKRPGDAAPMAFIEYLGEDLLAAKVEGKVLEAKTDKKEKKAKAPKAEKPKKEAKAATEGEEKPAKKAKAEKAEGAKAKKPAAKKEAKAKKA